MDLRHSRQTSLPLAFQAGATQRGAVLPVSGEVVIAALEEMLTERRALPAEDSWLTAGVPSLRKGEALIVPLAWLRDAEPADSAELRAQTNSLWSAIQAASEYRWMHTNGIDLDVPRAVDSPTYAAELLRTGARRADWWGPGDSLWRIVLVTYGAPLPAPVDAAAVHVIPIEWIDGEMPPTDLNWSWDEVVALAAAKTYADDVAPPGPFHRSTVNRGALLPSDARDLIVQHHGLLPGATEPTEDGWLAENVPVLVRGEAKVIPLTWRGDVDRGWNPYADDDIRTFVSRVRDSIIDAAGPATSVDLTDTSEPVDSTGSYRQALQNSRADRAEWWRFDDGTTVALVWTRGWPAVALHVVPASWLDESLATDPIPDLDLRWSWKQVVELDNLTIDLA